jgi:hypothetical protein
MPSSSGALSDFLSKHRQLVWSAALFLLCYFIGTFTIEATLLKSNLDEYNAATSKLYTSYLDRARLGKTGNVKPAQGEKEQPSGESGTKSEAEREIAFQEYWLQTKRLGIIVNLCAHVDTAGVEEQVGGWAETIQAVIRTMSAAIRGIVPERPWRNLDRSCSIALKLAVAPALASMESMSVVTADFQVVRFVESYMLFMSNFILPALYGLLGSILWIYRLNSGYISTAKESRENFEKTVKENGYTTVAIQRLCLGIIAGLVIGWFSQPATKVLPQFTGEVTPASGYIQLSIAPYAVAFLIGHSVEVLFDILERVALALSGPVRRANEPRDLEGGRAASSTGGGEKK